MNPTNQPWLELPINPAEPLVMHVDMNSCFATMEQQANPLLRGRPVAVAAYTSPYGCIIAPSVEAKQLGIKTGMRVKEGLQLCPDLFIIQSNPTLYRDAHVRFKRIFESYTSKVTPKSIDEAVIDFGGAVVLDKKNLVDIGREIKLRVKKDIGEWVRVNVGIGTNRFLAKTAAGLEKPDGLVVINKDNLLDVYKRMDLIDITGINHRYAARLNRAGIFSPTDFYNASQWKLKKEVFHSIVGYYWYLKLRGWEIEDYSTKRQSIGHEYTVLDRSPSAERVSRIVMKLCEKVGRRLRRNGLVAEGIHVYVLFASRKFWHEGMRTHMRLYTTGDIYSNAMKLFNTQPIDELGVAKIGVTVYRLSPYDPQQLSIFDGSRADKDALSRALDSTNDRYGDMVVGSALLVGMGNFVPDRVAFGSVKDMQDLYSEDTEEQTIIHE